MLNLDEFIKKNNGLKLDSDGSAHGSATEYQCVDLCNAWLKNLVAPAIRGNAVNWAGARGFEWIKNTPLNVPRPGDIVVWNCGKYGHVAIFVSGNVLSFTSFDQNWPVNSACHLQKHSYIGVMGWLRWNSNITTALFPKLIEVVRPAYVRSAPSTRSSLAGSRLLNPGSHFTAVELVKGDSVANNDKWYRSDRGNFVWSGNCS